MPLLFESETPFAFTINELANRVAIPELLEQIDEEEIDLLKEAIDKITNMTTYSFVLEDDAEVISISVGAQSLTEEVAGILTTLPYPAHVAATILTERVGTFESYSDISKRILLDIALESEISQIEKDETNVKILESYYGASFNLDGISLIAAKIRNEGKIEELIENYRSLQTQLREHVSPTQAPERE